MDAYYKDYIKDYPMVVRAAWGFTVETATQSRSGMVLSGVFEEVSEAEDHPRPSRRDAAVPGVAHRSGAGAAGPEVAELPRRLLQAISISRPAATSPIRRCFAA